MFISRLEIIGFKSFANHTLLEFKPGVMVVVGPNGCGKTNIVDAIRWVLGEQRSGVMRADKMEAVIFNGSQKRKPLSMAEASLTIENDRGVLPSPYSEVVLTRRLFRSGESEYLINRQLVRLRDIQDLFSDTGFGHTTYSIMELNMVERIITGSSEARRALIDEAAGIAKYKSRRNAAERRLTETRENLARLEDIFGEVEKQFRQLKRQAGRARRHRDLARALQLKQLRSLAAERLQLVAAVRPTSDSLKECEDKLTQCEERNERLSEELAGLEAQEITLLDSIGRQSESLKKLERRAMELKGEIALAEQRYEFLKVERTRTTELINDFQNRISGADRQIAALTAEINKLAALIPNREAELSATAIRLSNIVEQDQQQTKIVQSIRDREAVVAGKLQSLSAEYAKRMQERERLEARIQIRQTELNRIVKQKDESGKRKDILEKEINDINEEKNTLGDRLNKTVKSIAELQNTIGELRARLAVVEPDIASLIGQINSLKSRSENRSDWPKPLLGLIEKQNLETIAERLECPDEYRIALTAALESVLNGVDAADWGIASELLSTLKTGERVVMRLPFETGAEPEELPITFLPQGAISASQLVPEGLQLSRFLKKRLGKVIVVANWEAVVKISDWARENAFTVVAMTGERFEPDGILFLGRPDPNGAQVGTKQRLKSLYESLNEKERALREIKAELTQARKKLTEAEQMRDRIQRRMVALVEKAEKLSSERAALAAAIESHQRRLFDYQSEIEEWSARLAEPDESMVEGSADNDRLKAELDQISTIRSQAEAALNQLDEERVKLLDIRSNLTAFIEQAKSRIASAEKELRANETERERIRDELAKNEAASARREEELLRITGALSSLKSQTDLVMREKGSLSQALEQIQSQRAVVVKRRGEIRAELDELGRKQRELLKERVKFEGELVHLQERLKEVDRRLIEDVKVMPETLDEEFLATCDRETDELGYADLSVEAIRRRLDALGPINMLAVDELTDVEQRYKFLTDQRQDLNQGIEILEETIDRINHEARLKFRETFELVNQNFQSLFRTLFEGGEARLNLEGDDPLEGDIRIWATPTGKKLQSLSMLSGGEKSLTAIALLFAIYLVRPSPFCILDEIDAPLDDANVVRFNKLLARFTTDTQFLVVTHNKRTMEAGDCLFGVTLGEDGTSQIVSVRIEREGVATSSVG